MMTSNFRKVDSKILKHPIEVVYFIFPTCNGNCSHCWSNKMKLGTVVPYEQHKKNIEKISLLNIKEIKLSGGEPFFNKDIGKIIEFTKNKLKNSKITIFTSGRPFVSTKRDKIGIEETYKNLCSKIKNFNNISIHMSADEYHADAIKRLSKSNLPKEELLKNHVQNFIGACEKIKKDYPKFDYKLKIHVDFNRLEYHRNHLYSWMDNEFWNNNVIKSEGLIRSGNAEKLKTSIKLEPSNQWSLFVLPGVDFVTETDKYIDLFIDNNKNLKLIPKTSEGIVIAGWWNLINKEAYYFKLSDINDKVDKIKN